MNSVGDFASVSARTASAACSTPSRLVATTSWPIERAPSTAILPASTSASTFALLTSASSSIAFCERFTACWPRSPASVNSAWNGAAVLPKEANQSFEFFTTLLVLSCAAAFTGAAFLLRRGLARRAVVFPVERLVFACALVALATVAVARFDAFTVVAAASLAASPAASVAVVAASAVASITAWVSSAITWIPLYCAVQHNLLQRTFQGVILCSAADHRLTATGWPKQERSWT